MVETAIGTYKFGRYHEVKLKILIEKTKSFKYEAQIVKIGWKWHVS